MGQFLDIAETVLRTSGKPLKPKEIVDLARDGGLFSDKLAGKTPEQTMKAKVSVDIRQKGAASRFVRTAPNTFFLRELLSDPSQVYDAIRQVPRGLRERILAFPSTVLDSVGRFQGIDRTWRPFLGRTLKEGMCQSYPRLAAEQREDLKQLLTYVIVTNGNHVLCFRRGTFNRVEDYLRGSLCIGFGGHVSELDQTLFNIEDYERLILDSTARELSEELMLPEADRQRLAAGGGLRILGLLNDDSSATGRKHLAVVLKYEVTNSFEWSSPRRGEKSITQLTWLNVERLGRGLREFEYWSQLCLVEFFRKAVRTQPSFVVRRRAPFQRPHILSIVGGLGSGKSVATAVLKAEFGYNEVNSGQVLAELLGIPPVPKTDRGEFQKHAWKFIRQKNGPAKLARSLIAKANESSGHALIDGIRQRATLEQLRIQASPKAVAVLFVYTPPHIAYKFYHGRGGHRLAISQYLRLREAPVELEVRKLIADADAVLYNWTGKLKYEQAVRKLMIELRS
ncbi:MAG TPA: HTH domain-containing protein [Candidatus Limnocylindrales bacterium]|nr:HTH domain-containing protein [Candidatus Limnocylindrales bacterium]